ncbi:hypothetical protein GCM10009623_22190 [Nocardioides aestuarii]|uniref:Major facilitator superfamily (MFS) profile domain-containing protein n=1 Tax=Nocardioides aestuarii TaxID=252231 RepID=A0ABW4TQP1_9ACTN
MSHSAGTGPDRDTRDRRSDRDDESIGSTSRWTPPARERSRGGDRKAVVAREREEHGGIKWGSAFFGFLTATGVTVLLTALAAALGAAVGLATDTGAGEAAAEAADSAGTVGLFSGIVLLVILFVAYYCGGYVAGRMARFDGTKQGLAVWVWALVVAVVVAVLAVVAGANYNVLSELNSFPRIPVSEGDLTTGGIVAAVLLVVVTLLGAALGGLAGMRFHRTVDRTGLGV